MALSADYKTVCEQRKIDHGFTVEFMPHEGNVLRATISEQNLGNLEPLASLTCTPTGQERKESGDVYVTWSCPNLEESTGYSAKLITGGLAGLMQATVYKAGRSLAKISCFPQQL